MDAAARYGALDLTPQAQRARTLEALVGQLLGLAARQPVLFVMEDAHWTDPTTLELIGLSLDHIAKARVLILLTSRPDHQPEIAAHPHVTRLTLNRLGRSGIEMIVARLGGDRLPSETIDAIIARTDGVPLFVEELTKAILETGETSIPASLHDSLMARLDRSPEVKEVAQFAACIGREFAFSLLAAVAGKTEADLLAALDQLGRAELIFRRGMPPNAAYSFKHALVRDAAYESLLRSKRQKVHAGIARSIEADFPETVASEPELLAHHHACSGALGQAIEYWRRAADRAMERSASRDAVEHLTKALQALEHLPEIGRRSELEAALQTRVGAAFTAAKGQAAPEVEAAYLRARDLCQASGDEHQLFVVLRGLWLCYQVGSKLDAAHRIGEDLLELAQSIESTVHLVEAYRALGQTALWSGRFVQSRDYFGRGLAVYDPQIHAENAHRFGQDPRVISSCMAAITQWILGYPDQARRGMRQGLNWAEELNHPYSRSVAGIVSAFFYTVLRDVRETRSAAERTIEVATKYEFPFFLAFATVYRGRTTVLQGSVQAGLDEIRRGFDIFAIKTEAWWYFPLVDICMDAGLIDQSHEALTQAFEAVERSNDRLVEAELYRLKGELVLRGEAPAERERHAQKLFEESLAVARAQEAKSWELRAATSLARLYRDQGKRQQGHDLLASVYTWFTEGFNTPDLRDARALLEELG